MSRTLRLAASLAITAFLAACATVSHTPPTGGEEAQPTVPESAPAFVPEPGRDAETVARFRAAPPPEAPEIAPGTSPVGDLNRLAALGMVRIGTARFPGDEVTVRDAALAEGRRVGADRILLYAPGESEQSAGSEPDAGRLAVYFVRFKLPFGATFRDLSADERARVGAGVRIGSVIGGTPASRANLLAGDFVVRLDGRSIANKGVFQDLLRANAGKSVTLTLIRNGETRQRMVQLGAIPSASTP
jgi:hypothetical protein